ncbi:hypothetical protein [Helicobacter anatolicus]|nr:hypothetical protein [Helicobacter anatolicus]
MFHLNDVFVSKTRYSTQFFFKNQAFLKQFLGFYQLYKSICF